MNFQLSTIGHSFKGSMAYYLHDKRQDEAGPHPVTAERVGWTETRNLATDGAHTATRIMIATAQSADQLKAAAGVKNTGRKSTAGPVFAFSLAWHPDERDGLTREEMSAAADHALRTLGLDQLQAVLIEHRDTAHPHVHVIVNRVDPNTGKTAVIRKPDVVKLDQWADRYEQERGKIVSPNRAAKYDAIEQKRRQHPDPAARAAKIEEGKRQRAQEAEQRRKTAAPSSPAPAQAKPPTAAPARQQSEAAKLKERGDEQKRRHAAAWAALTAKNKARRDQVYSSFEPMVSAVYDRHKQLARPFWSQHFRQERTAAQAFNTRERDLFGVIANALTAAKQQMAAGTVPGRGLLSLTFANVLNAPARAAAFTAQQETRRGELARQLRAARDQEIAALKAARAAALDRERQAFAAERAHLIQTQAQETAAVRSAWREIYDRRGRAAPTRAQQDAAPIMEPQTVNKDFDKARGVKPANLSPHPTERRHVSTPAPAPAPAGIPTMPARQVQDVPRKPDPIMPTMTPRPLPAQDWTKAATPAGTDWAALTSKATTSTDAPKTDWAALHKPLTAEQAKAAAQKPETPTQGPKIKQ